MHHRFAVIGTSPVAQRVIDMLANHTEVIQAGDGSAAARLIDEQGVTAVLVVADLGSTEGCRASARALGDTALTAVPVLVVSRKTELDRCMDALRLGAGAVLDAACELADIQRIIGCGPEEQRIEPLLDRSQHGALRRAITTLKLQGFSGVVEVSTADTPGVVALVDGKVVRAEYAGLHGSDAYKELLGPAPTVLDFKVASAAPVAVAPRCRPNSLSVLLIDDDPVARHLYRAFLIHAGFDVTDAPDAVAGLERARAMHPDVVITDLHMPKVDGWRVIADLRSDPTTADARIVLYSAYHELLDQLAQAGTGADAYVKKDGHARALIEAVAQQGAARVELRAALEDGTPFACSTQELTMGALLHDLALSELSSLVVLDDGFAHVELRLDRGDLLEASGRSSCGNWSGRAALALALGLHPARIEVTPIAVADSEARTPLSPLVNGIRAKEHDDELAERVRRLAHDSPLDFDDARLRVYRRQCAAEVRPLLSALRSGRSARALIATGGWDPLLVDGLVNDVVTRGVARASRVDEIVDFD